MSTIASIRNSINTADEFYDKEQNYWDEYGPLYTELNTDFHKAIVNSKFKEEIKKWRQGKQTAIKTYKNLNISKSSFYKIVKKVK